MALTSEQKVMVLAALHADSMPMTADELAERLVFSANDVRQFLHAEREQGGRVLCVANDVFAYRAGPAPPPKPPKKLNREYKPIPRGR